MRLLRIALLLTVALALDWAPGVPPYPLHGVAQVRAQQLGPGIDGLPPNRFHPYKGATNCVQVVDANGNFSCSALVTINPATGQFNAALGGAVSTAVALVVGPLNNTLGALGSDLVIAKSPTTTTAPAGPGAGITLRVRPSPRVPGYCMLVAVAGNSFGTEYPIAFLNPSLPLQTGPLGVAGINAAQGSDYFFVDLPGGPGGC